MNSYEKIELPYKLSELEPIISHNTMIWHYNVLHENYKQKLLETLRGRKSKEKSTIEKQFPSLASLMEKLETLPKEIKDDIRFFGGGLINHNLFFAHLTKYKKNHKSNEEEINFDLLNLIKKYFNSLEELKNKLAESASKIRGSGWTWLVLKENNVLKIINTVNQDSPWILHLRPLIAIDVWEHAYFLDYGNNRKKYVNSIFENLLNWKYINKLYFNYVSL